MNEGYEKNESSGFEQLKRQGAYNLNGVYYSADGVPIGKAPKRRKRPTAGARPNVARKPMERQQPQPRTTQTSHRFPVALLFFGVLFVISLTTTLLSIFRAREAALHFRRNALHYVSMVF